VHETGEPDVMVVEEVEAPDPAEGEALVRLDAIGVNFIDVNQRSGAYPISLPFTPGTEGAGVVEAVGPGVSEVSPGDRVAYAGVPASYSQYVAAKASRLVPLPDVVGTDVAAAVMLQGMTAHYLVNSICTFDEGDWCLIHAAAGGVGLLLTQLAKRRGLQVIGTVSTSTKADRARGAGVDQAIDYTQEDFAAAVHELTHGAGVRAVFESVGKSTLDKSFECLSKRGYMVLFGQASGPVDPVDIRRLQRGGSLFLTRPGLVDYTSTREELLWRGQEIMKLVASGDLEVSIHERYPMTEAPAAHRALQSRQTTGKLLLIP
jgi:NADPH2:quinone reductase